jgi:hypothetical protein
MTTGYDVILTIVGQDRKTDPIIFFFCPYPINEISRRQQAIGWIALILRETFLILLRRFHSLE